MRFPNTRSVSGYSIPMITELVIDANVQFLDQDDDDGKCYKQYIIETGDFTEKLFRRFKSWSFLSQLR